MSSDIPVVAKEGFTSGQVILGALVGLVVIFVVNQLFGRRKPAAPVLRGAGAQNAAHRSAAKGEGDAAANASSSSFSAASSSSSAPVEVFLNQTKQVVRLTSKTALSHDTFRFRFNLPAPDLVLGLPVGKHFKIYGPNDFKPAKEGEWNGQPDKEHGKKEITRSYTPVTSDRDLGYFELVVKIYRPNEPPRFVDGGKLSRYLETLNEGDPLVLAGPYGRIEYTGRGSFKIERKQQPLKRCIGMIAGGTGITPMLQVIAAVLSDPEDATELWLLFANQTEGDILVRDYLERHQQEHPGRFRLWYTLDRPPEGWQYSSGFISEQMVREHLPAPSDDTVILMCGPPPMIQYACTPNLNAVGHAKEAQIVF